jgi:hypothetical protein
MSDERSLTREQILAATDVAIERLEVPEWGGVVYLKALTARERDAYEISCLKTNRQGKREFDGRNVRAKLASLTLVDESGARLFSEEDMNALGRKSAKALDRIFDKATDMNGLSERDREALEGNSNGRDDDSSSDSPWPVVEPTSDDSPASSHPGS